MAPIIGYTGNARLRPSGPVSNAPWNTSTAPGHSELTPAAVTVTEDLLCLTDDRAINACSACAHP
jgi:hypothetical protein